MTETLIIERKKKINRATILLIILSFVFILFIPSVSAKEERKYAQGMADYIATGVFDVISTTLQGTDPTDEDEVSYAKFYAYMVGDEFQSNFATPYNAIKVLGVVVLIVIALGRAFNVIQTGQDAQEVGLKVIIEICIGGAIIMNVDTIMSLLAQMGSYLGEVLQYWTIPSTSSMAGSLEMSTGDTLLENLTGNTDGGLIWNIKTMMMLVLPYALTALLKIVAKFVVIQILLEIGIRRIFAPFAVADVYAEGLRSPGVRYFKKYLATFFKMLICLVICALGTCLLGLLSGTSGVAYIFEVLAIEFTCLGMMFKTGEIANDILGV